MATLIAPPHPKGAIPYLFPRKWTIYDQSAIFTDLVEAKSAVLSLKAIPYQRDWVERMQEMQLKMEVAGTSKIEGADFTDNELDAALNPSAQASDLLTRSQKQAHAAVQTYRWIAGLPDDLPITEGLIKDIHGRMVTECDDDHCGPGILRGHDQNVTFGLPRHRGADGGHQCQKAFSALVSAINHEFKALDPILQAMALHYHFAAMHPFLDGNGRTARALEALLLQRAGLRDTAFIAMSNYYYDEKSAYLSVLSEVRKKEHDLTPFFLFGLRGVRLQCERLYKEITTSVRKAVFRNMMFDLFLRLRSPRKRVIADRQIEVLKVLLFEKMLAPDLARRMDRFYGKLKNPTKAFVRDVNGLIHLGAVTVSQSGNRFMLEANLDWPEQMNESDFMEKVKSFPKAKSHAFLNFLA